jgi:hypothetical protein
MDTTTRYSTPAAPPRLIPRAATGARPVPPVLSLRAAGEGHSGPTLVGFGWAPLLVRGSRR